MRRRSPLLFLSKWRPKPAIMGKKRPRPSGGKRQQQPSKSQPSRTVQYSPADHVLLLGDGDFSYSRGLCKALHGGRKAPPCFVASSLDTAKEVRAKYSKPARSATM